MIDLLLEAARLKALDRTGWVRKGVPSPESVAAHSWGVSWLVLLLLPDDLDRGRALTYAALHDLPEVRVGDLAPSDGVAPEDKARREHTAMADLCRAHPHLVGAWEAYEAQADAESRFVRQLDRLDMAIQAVVYAEAGAEGMNEFLASAAEVIEHPALAAVLRGLALRTSASRP